MSIHRWVAAENLQLGVWPYINDPPFARAIAGISFYQAVAKFGLNGFNHLDLPALILGQYANITHYVEVSRDIPPPPNPRHGTHKVEIQEYVAGGKPYWLVSLRLFAHSGSRDNGMPIYRTIVRAPLFKTLLPIDGVQTAHPFRPVSIGHLA